MNVFNDLGSIHYKSTTNVVQITALSEPAHALCDSAPHKQRRLFDYYIVSN
jgi:hypothetical protein